MDQWQVDKILAYLDRIATALEKMAEEKPEHPQDKVIGIRLD